MFGLVIAFLVNKTQETYKEKNLPDSGLLSIPSIEVYNLNNETVKLDSLCSEGKTIIVCFDTDCDICQIEAREFRNLQNKFEDSRVVFISNNAVDEIRKFITDNGLDDSGYIFLNDKDYQLVRNYNIPTMPYMLLYIDSKLYKSYKGGINIEQIIKDKHDR